MRRKPQRSSSDTSFAEWKSECKVARALIVVGLLIAAVGALMHFGVPVGRLPGDIVVRRGNSTFYLPIVTCILASLLLTIVMAVFRR